MARNSRKRIAKQKNFYVCEECKAGLTKEKEKLPLANGDPLSLTASTCADSDKSVVTAPITKIFAASHAPEIKRWTRPQGIESKQDLSQTITQATTRKKKRQVDAKKRQQSIREYRPTEVNTCIEKYKLMFNYINPYTTKVFYIPYTTKGGSQSHL